MNPGAKVETKNRANATTDNRRWILKPEILNS